MLTTRSPKLRVLYWLEQAQLTQVVLTSKSLLLHLNFLTCFAALRWRNDHSTSFSLKGLSLCCLTRLTGIRSCWAQTFLCLLKGNLYVTSVLLVYLFIYLFVSLFVCWFLLSLFGWGIVSGPFSYWFIMKCSRFNTEQITTVWCRYSQC